jgi:hypothetical protein
MSYYNARERFDQLTSMSVSKLDMSQAQWDKEIKKAINARLTANHEIRESMQIEASSAAMSLFAKVMTCIKAIGGSRK